MSTRANIVIKDSYNLLWFYRHSDGYPEGAMPTLQVFINWIRQHKIRDNVSQGSGWLILIGAAEYASMPIFELAANNSFGRYGDISTIKPPADWKTGAYEPTTGVHGDIEFLYIIDLEKAEITCYDKWDDDGKPVGKPLFTDTEKSPWTA